MSVPSLEDIALYTSIKYIWENSELQSLTVERVHTAAKTRNLYVADDVCKNKIDNIIHPILGKMMTFKCLPHQLRVRWVIAFEGICKELENWAFEICRGAIKLHRHTNIEIVKFCINRIKITQTGFIDKPKTMLKVMEDSQFQIQFDPLALLVKNVEEKILCSLGKQVLEEKDDRGAKMPRLEHDIGRTIARTLKSYRYSVLSWHRDIENSVERARQKDFSHCCAGKLALLAQLGDLSTVNQYVSQQRELSPDSLQEQIQQAARFMITQYSSNLEMIMFLFHNMERRHLIEVLNKDFKYIFDRFLRSRRYRSLCLRLFRDVAQTINPERFEYMFRGASLAWVNTKYDYYDIMPILQSIWLEAPDPLKQSEIYIFIIIPEMFTVHYDLDMLAFFLNSYDIDRQKHCLAQIIVCLFNKKKEHLIHECLIAAPQLKLNLDNYKTIIDTEFMKKHLLQHWPFGFLNFCFKDYLKLLDSMYHGNIDAFKRELLKDKDFMNNYLDQHWLDNIDEFLSWCHNDDAISVKKYTTPLLDEGLIQNVYENVLIGIDEISLADLGLETLQLSDGEIQLLKTKIMNKPKVKKAMLDSILNHECLRMDVIKSEFSFYFNEEQEQESMERLFLCEEARDAILALLIPSLTRFEEDPCLRSPISEFLQDFLYKVKVLFEPHSLQNRIDEMLHEYGHPNLRTEKIYSIDGVFGVQNAHEMSVARKLVDCNYRCVRALLRRDFTAEQLREAERRDVTALSLDLAAQASLDIPVVL